MYRYATAGTLKVAVAILTLSLLVGCATQRYGRLTPLSPGERASLTCEQIALESEKTQFFLSDVQRQRRETTPAHVLGALGDFGIGNVMEGNAAEKSGRDRLVQLHALAREKDCPITTARSGGEAEASGPETLRISSQEDFVAQVVGRRLTDASRTMTIVVNADGTLSGTHKDGRRLTGPWYFDDGFFCREPTFGGENRGWDCTAVFLEGEGLIFHRDHGTGERVRYTFL